MNLKKDVPKIARAVALLGPGPVAELRRDPASGAGSAAYWRIAAEYDIRLDDNIMPSFVQMVAILTPRGNISERISAHRRQNRMGEALYFAGVSELRLARFLSAPKAHRPDLSVRISRRLARTKHAQFNLITLAYFLYSKGDEPARIIAREYYRAEYRQKPSLEKET